MSTGAARIYSLLGGSSALALSAAMIWRWQVADAQYLRQPAALCLLVGWLCLWAARQGAPGWLQRAVAGTSSVVLHTGLLLVLAELGCRAVGVDFHDLLGARVTAESYPTYFRLPSRPVGQVAFTREPHSSWHGRPLQTLLQLNRATDVAYTDEAEVRITWDQDGFRNPAGLADWHTVVVGDSFVESGYLPAEQLFTGVAAQKLGQPVKNLGISDTGNFSHSYFLHSYGRAPGCKHAVLAWFEGNDLTDNVREAQQLASGERPSHDIPPEPSLLRMLYHLVRDADKLRLTERSYANALFSAKKVPVTLADAPPASRQITAEQVQALNHALDQWAKICQQQGVAPHLLYLPAKRRALHGHVILQPQAPELSWQDNDLPTWIAARCAERQIHFINATPVLKAASAAGVLTYNAIYDTHLNAAGHRIVGELLAQELAGN